MSKTTKNYCRKVSSVLVTYNPNMEALRVTIQAVLNQVSDIFIVDNASENFSNSWFEEFKDQTNTKLHLFRQQENLGIGATHNIGIKHAIDQGAELILLLDQDSQIETDMVVKLLSAYDTLNDKGIQVAAIGPRYRDAGSGILSPFLKVEGSRLIECNCENDTFVVNPDFLISSGSLLPVVALESVGLMDASLFIDLVDIEWCYRAKAKGWQICGLCNAIMTHSLGEQRDVTWRSRKRVVPFHKPFRYYYMFRNSILLYRRDYIPSHWKIADLINRFKIAVFFTCMADDERWLRLKMMCLGVVDGLRNKNGKRNFFT
jgi:rhamnosyltransferase